MKLRACASVTSGCASETTSSCYWQTIFTYQIWFSKKIGREMGALGLPWSGHKPKSELNREWIDAHARLLLPVLLAIELSFPCQMCELLSKFEEGRTKAGRYRGRYIGISGRRTQRQTHSHALKWFLPKRDYVTFGSLLSQIRLSIVCNVGALHPTQGLKVFQQYFFTAVYLSHPLTSVQNFALIVGALNARGVPK